MPKNPPGNEEKTSYETPEKKKTKPHNYSPDPKPHWDYSSYMHIVSKIDFSNASGPSVTNHTNSHSKKLWGSGTWIFQNTFKERLIFYAYYCWSGMHNKNIEFIRRVEYSLVSMKDFG